MSHDLFGESAGRKRARRRKPADTPAPAPVPVALGAPSLDRDSYLRAAEALKLAEPIRRLERLADDLDELRIKRGGRRLRRVADYLRSLAGDIYEGKP